MHRVDRRRPQGGHGVLLADHAGEELGGRALLAHRPAPAAGASPSRSRTDATICAVSAPTSALPSTTSQCSGSAGGLGEEPLADPGRELGAEPLHPVGAAPARGGEAGGGHVDADVDQDRQVGRQAAGGPGHQLGESGGVEAPAVALVGDGRRRRSGR